MTRMEDRWLNEWVRDIVSCDQEHLERCVEAGGAFGAPEADMSLRWPGNLGLDYEIEPQKRRLLCVAQIHLASEWQLSGRDNLGILQNSMRDWRDGTLKSAAFIATYRSKYADLLSNWGPWIKGFAPIVESPRIGLTTSRIAYVNMAKCWRPAGGQYRVMKLCERRFHLASLCDIIKPKAVLILSSDSVLKIVKPSLPSGQNSHNCGTPYNNLSQEQVEEAIQWLLGLGF